MITVALIGADGAGKTTIAKKLVESFPMPMKYIYMGANIESSNFALPTSRMILHLKLHLYRRAAKRTGNSDPNFVSTHHIAHRLDKRGKIAATARLLNRLAEHLLRQIICWSYQLRGYIVLYDRHVLFDFAPNKEGQQRLTDRIFRWLLNHSFPQPDLVIFLDAPPEVLFRRKEEATLEYLQRKQEAFLEQGEKTANFVQIDATQPLDNVFGEVRHHITQYINSKKIEKIHDSYKLAN